MKIKVYTSKGVRKSAGYSLPKEYVEKENPALLAQAIRVYEDRRHPKLSKTKTRGEISLTKRKAYRQKGTGLARHGAKSAPLFVGGSKAHGPKGLKRKLSLPKKMRKKAMIVALSQKAKKGRVVGISNIGDLKKTKEAARLFQIIADKEKYSGKNKNFTIAISKKNLSATKALRNLADVKIFPFSNLNVYDVYFGGMIALDVDAFGERSKGGANKKPAIAKTQKEKKTQKVGVGKRE
jgi:large subunit ribosomal protein L4